MLRWLFAVNVKKCVPAAVGGGGEDPNAEDQEAAGYNTEVLCFTKTM